MQNLCAVFAQIIITGFKDEFKDVMFSQGMDVYRHLPNSRK